MFNALTNAEQKEVIAVMNELGDDKLKALRPLTASVYPESTYTHHLECVRDMVAMVLTDRQETASDFINEDLVPTLFDVIHFFYEMCDKNISMGDRIPDYRITDLFTIAATSHGDHWKELIANNLSYIPSLVKQTQGGINVSTALFDAIINTAFDYDMQG